jgi:K+ transporter
MIGLQACQLSMLETKKNMRGEIMSKTLSLFFAIVSIALMLAMTFSLSHNGWLALLFGVLTVAVIGTGFVVKARLRKKNS